MARTIRFRLDECCDPAIADGLRRRGIDVTTSQEAGLIEAEDEQQAAYGLAEERVVFTHDADFLRLQAAGVPHAGIVYRAKDTLSLGEMIKRLVLIWEIYESAEMVNRVEFLRDDQPTGCLSKIGAISGRWAAVLRKGMNRTTFGAPPRTSHRPHLEAA